MANDPMTDEEREMIDEFIRTKGVRKCAMGEESVKIDHYMARARKRAGAAFSRAKISQKNRAELYLGVMRND